MEDKLAPVNRLTACREGITVRRQVFVVCCDRKRHSMLNYFPRGAELCNLWGVAFMGNGAPHWGSPKTSGLSW